MHKTSTGWQKDTNTDCKEDKLDILKYCQSVSNVNYFQIKWKNYIFNMPIQDNYPKNVHVDMTNLSCGYK